MWCFAADRKRAVSNPGPLPVIMWTELNNVFACARLWRGKRIILSRLHVLIFILLLLGVVSLVAFLLQNNLQKICKKNDFLKNNGNRKMPYRATKCLDFKEARKSFSLLQCLWNDGRLQRRIFNGVGKLYVSLQLYCWAILWGYLWRHISYHGNAQGPQKRPLNFSFCKLSEKLIRWPTIFISLLESSLNSLTFQTVWKKFIQ